MRFRLFPRGDGSGLARNGCPWICRPDLAFDQDWPLSGDENAVSVRPKSNWRAEGWVRKSSNDCMCSVRVTQNSQKQPMKTNKYLLLSAMLVMAVATSARAQVQTTGTPGSPSATTTIDGKQLPAPPSKFGGVIKESVKDSTPYWPPRVVPPKSAPNILLIMTDDAGYGISSTFGGVIPTPALDRIAKAGLRYTQFHSTAL